MLTDLQRDALRVITELSDMGSPPTAVRIADELDVYYSEACRVTEELRRGGHVKTDEIWWYPLTRVELLPDDTFVGFFEDVNLVREFEA
jgi:Mn-dependent DtxR family transcriptional regulator